MQTIIQSCILILWMQILTSAKSEACTLEQFINGDLYDSNFDISNIEDSYAPGRQIRVNCRVGYSGFFKLICTNNGWDHKGKKCEPKPCGHPGDATFADFALEKANDFVFGSQVVYTCHTGFQMISRINYRNCLAEGWDGTIPICEAIRCPAVHVSDNVQVFGELNDASYGNVVRFNCKYRHEVLRGSQESYCNEKGEWSSPPPKCEEIICLKPTVENGIVRSRTKEYKENEFLNFDCLPGFKPDDNISSKCTKVGDRAEWTPAPRCEPVRCKLILPPGKGTSYNPEYQNRFKPGDNITVTCGDEYWISDTMTTIVNIKCKSDGKWSMDPICREVRCNLNYQHPIYRLHWSYYDRKYSIKLHETHGYDCAEGYKKPAGIRRATCTREGLGPDPLCKEIFCLREDIPHTELVNYKDKYGYGQTATYKCIDRYTGSFSLSCGRDGQWRGHRHCEEFKCNIDHNQNTYTWDRYKTSIKLDETLGYECKSGYKKTAGEEGATCTTEGLKPFPLCQDIQCDQTEFPNTMLINKHNKYFQGARAEYKCINGYEGEFFMYCGSDGQWHGTPKCKIDEKCTKPIISGAVPQDDNKESYNHKDRVKFRCSDNESRIFDVVCQMGNWTGIQDCSGCAEPEIINGFAKGPYNKILYYTCDEGFKLNTEGWWAQAKCEEGQWIGLQSCIEESRCGPVPPIPNGEVKFPQPSYEENHSVEIDCKPGYKAQPNRLRCKNGEWHPKDIKLDSICDYAARTCSPPAEIDNAVILTQFQNVYLSESEVTYVCRGGQKEETIRCTDGAWEKTTLICTSVFHPSVN